MQTLADGHLRKISVGPREAEAELEWLEHLLALRFVGFALEQIKEAPCTFVGPFTQGDAVIARGLNRLWSDTTQWPRFQTRGATKSMR